MGDVPVKLYTSTRQEVHSDLFGMQSSLLQLGQAGRLHKQKKVTPPLIPPCTTETVTSHPLQFNLCHRSRKPRALLKNRSAQAHTVSMFESGNMLAKCFEKVMNFNPFASWAVMITFAVMKMYDHTNMFCPPLFNEVWIPIYNYSYQKFIYVSILKPRR
jgi:hypothetical protein